MTVNFKELFNNLKIYGRGKNYKVFLIFVMVSTFSWLLIKFSKQYTALVRFPVTYTSIPEDMVWGEVNDNFLEISTTASGFQQLSFAFNRKKIKLDLSEIRQLENEQYYLLPKNQISSIIQQFPGNLELTYRSPDTLFFDLSKKVKKRVPVVLNDSISLTPSFKITKDITITPDSITIIGPSSIVKKIDHVDTRLYLVKNLRKNKNVKIKIVKIDSDKLEFSDDFVEVSVVVEQFTQSTIKLPISIKNVPEGYMLKIFPKETAITFNASLSNFESIDASSFMISADYNKIVEDNSQIIPLDILPLTNKVEIVKTDPTEVEFLLRKIE